MVGGEAFFNTRNLGHHHVALGNGYVLVVEIKRQDWVEPPVLVEITGEDPHRLRCRSPELTVQAQIACHVIGIAVAIEIPGHERTPPARFGS